MSFAAIQKGGDLARLAGIWCNDAAFRQWLGVDTAIKARDRLCFTCGVESRANIDHNPTAAKIFNDAFRKPYRDHLQETKR